MTREIYDYSGLRELLQALQPGGKWRPARGLAEKLRKFAVDHAGQLRRIRNRHKARGGGSGGGGGGGLSLSSRLSLEANGHSSTPSPTGGYGGGRAGTPVVAAGGDGVRHEKVIELAAAHDRLVTRVDSGTARLEEKLDELITIVKGASSGLRPRSARHAAEGAMRGGGAHEADEVTTL